MDASLALQYVVVASAVIASAWIVLAKQLPNTARRLRIACAAPLVRVGRPGWMRAVGRRLAPPAISEGGSACGACASCEPPPR